MSNTILTSSMIAKEALMILENKLVFARNVNRQYEKEWNGATRKMGDTVTVRKPAQYTVRSGAAISVQNHVETGVPVQLANQKGVDVQFTSKELTLSIGDFSEQVLQPQIAVLANQVDLDGLLMAYRSTANAVGVPGTVPNALLTYLNAGALMDNEACPSDDKRGIIVNPASQATIVDALKGLFQSSTEIKSQYERGKMGTAGGFDWAMSQNTPTHIVGPLGGTPLVNGAAQVGSSLITNGWTAAAAARLKQGDVFTLAGVYQVNPLSKQSTNVLRQFVVTADVSSDGSGNATIGIYPAIVVSGATQNVTASPASGAALTVLGAAGTVSPVNLASHKDAFTLVTADLALPKGMDMASRASDDQAGLSIRFIRGYDIVNDLFISRLDILYGWAALRPEHACRIQS